jgi:integrase
MAGKQAKVLSEQEVEDLLFFAKTTRNPDRNRVIVLLSVKAGLRAAEIANLSWDMVTDAMGNVSPRIELRDHAAKMGGGRTIPMNTLLHDALVVWRAKSTGNGPVIASERGGNMTPLSIVIWFARAYEALGLAGCSSHSGRRTFVTRAARVVHKARGLSSGRSTPRGSPVNSNHAALYRRYSDAQRRLVSLI